MLNRSQTEPPDAAPATGSGTVLVRETILDLEAQGRIHCRYHEPPGLAEDLAILVHGSESHAAWYEGVARRLAAHGVAALAYDRPGWGRGEGPRGVLTPTQPALAQLAAVRAAAANGHRRVHLVGMSWGGLLAAAARLETPRLWASVTLLSPAIFPRRRLPVPRMLTVLLAWLGGDDSRLVPLPISVEDFAAVPALTQWIAGDQLRVTEVNARFLLLTAALQLKTRYSAPRADWPPAQVLMAEADPLIDRRRTERWARRHGVQSAVIPATRHALVLEAPETVAERILALIGRAGAGNPDRGRS